MVKLGKRFEQAIALAIELHGSQKRKFGKTPYISHLLCVAALVLQDGGDEEQAIAALLHDAVEDRGGRATLERIEKAFGARVAEMVEACSDSMEWPKKPWRQRKEGHLARLKDAPPEVCRVMLADKLCNTRSLLRGLRENGPQVWRHFNGGRDGSLWYFRQMQALLSAKAPGYMADELARVLDEIERLAG
jgi:(p)ppGpp synthase/HD superfamily hydrolase